MHPVDLTIFAVYIVAMLGVGLFFLRRNSGTDDYYVGGRNMGSTHIGLSVVATDVGGGFSIGLGGLGFAMGLSGSWMLFTGLLGAWLAAVFLIPRIKRNPRLENALTYPDLFRVTFGNKVAMAAGIISAIGYLGFTSSQILAGAKLASGTFEQLSLGEALIIMGVTAVVYTVLGGLKAVIYTDTAQWIILLAGLAFVGLPICYQAVGGWTAVSAAVPPEMLSLTSIEWSTFVNWMVTILPIWFVGMTLYQRIYACRDEKTAKRAWYLAGLFEWPVMAFLGVTLGLLGRVAASQGMFGYLGVEDASTMDPESGLPMLLRTVLPVGMMGLVMSAYFSAILSTADSCLMACSGNVLTDIVARVRRLPEGQGELRVSQILTLALGAIALVLATTMTSVLDLMLYSYAFMVSGLLVPTIAALFGSNFKTAPALGAMVVGGATTVTLGLTGVTLPASLDANVFGLGASLLVFLTLQKLVSRGSESSPATSPEVEIG